MTLSPRVVLDVCAVQGDDDPSGVYELKPGAQIPVEAELRKVITPDQWCAFESMLVSFSYPNTPALSGLVSVLVCCAPFMRTHVSFALMLLCTALHMAATQQAVL